MKKSDLIYVAGHSSMVGAAIVRALDRQGYSNLLLRTQGQLDLSDGTAVRSFFNAKRPDYVVLPATREGGFLSIPTSAADTIRQNFIVQKNIIEAAHAAAVQKLLLLSSACIYPADASIPIREELLQTGPLAPSCEPYAMAQLASIVMCQVYARRYGLRCVCAAVADLYGPGDDFGPHTCRVLPMLIRRLYEARESGAVRVELPGPGTVRLQYLHVEDLADACLFLMREREDSALINLGSGRDLSSHALAGMVAEVVGFPGGISFDDATAIDRVPSVLDGSRLEALGWAPRIELAAGIAATYRWYLESRALAVTPD